ncbi:Uncharacterised protein [Candidatus Tiddalikarchaeum anstoanum]|nr:Uncharacterised protein [Candidatus Tiddalikarchaeum anstoanum]
MKTLNKALSTLVLLVLFVLPVALAGGGNLGFQVQIIEDTTIIIPTLCEVGGNETGILEFSPGITLISDIASRPDDTCADAVKGDWNITNNGNVAINLNFKMNATAPTGVTIAIGNEQTYNASAYLTLTNADQEPLWAHNIPAIGADTVQVWQRIAADDTATGATTFQRTIIVSSTRHTT